MNKTTVTHGGEAWHVAWLGPTPTPPAALAEAMVDSEARRQRTFGGKGNTIESQVAGVWGCWAVWRDGDVADEYAATMLALASPPLEVKP